MKDFFKLENIQNINQKLKQIAKVLTFVFVFVFAFSNSWGQAILQWNTIGNLGTETSEPSVFNDPNLSATNLTFGAGVTPAANGNRFGGSNWFDAGNTAAGNTIAQAVAGNNYIEFIVTPTSGCSVTPTSLVFIWDKSATGPQNVALRSSADGFAANLGLVAPTAAIGVFNTITITGLTNIGTTTFRLYGYGATNTTGTGGFDQGGSSPGIVNVQLNGSTSCGNTITTGIVSNPPFALTDCTVTASGTVDFTSSGTFTGNTYTAQLSNASGSFAAPTNIGTLISNANSGTINITIPASTASGTGYLIRVVSSNPNVTGSSSAAFTITLTCAAASGSCTVGGAMGTGYTTGCGNGSSGCNLASVYSAFGTFCSASAVACGSCPNTNVSVTYNFESGCTATITAEYKARPAVSGTACNNSAMDSGDQIFITNSGGSVSAQTSTMQVTLTTCGAYPTIGTYTTATSSLSTGCGNSDGTVSMIITGGAATIGGVSDRGDEIITYTINASGTCSLCPTLLPVGLVDFYGTKNGSNNDVFWKISMEENIEYYIIEKSSDGVNFEPLGFLPVNSISNNLIKTYKLVDETPYNDITYYRLSVRESYGVVKVYNIIYVDWSASSDWNCIHYQQEQNLMIEFKNSVPKNSNVSLFDLSGKLLAEESVKNSQTVINVQNLAEGLYFIKIQSPYKTENFKIIIQK